SGRLAVCRLLLDQGAAVEQGNRRGVAPLFSAVRHGHLQVQHLVDHGASVEHVDCSGMRPATWAMATSKPDILMVLLSKLIQEGDRLYKQGNVREAAHSYQSALQKFPGDELKTFRHLIDFAVAEEFATKALELKAKSYEGFYARARAKRGRRQFHAALEDLIEASRLCPSNREIQRLLSRVKEECRQVAQQQDSPPPSSHPVYQPNAAMSSNHSACQQVQDREGLTEEEEEEEEEGSHSSPSFHPQPVTQGFDTHCSPGVPSPSSLSPTHLYRHLPSPTHSPSCSSPAHSAPPPPPSSSSYHHFSALQRPSPMSESMPALSGNGGLHQHPQSSTAPHHSDQNPGGQQLHHLSHQRSFQKQNSVQGQWLQPAKVQVVRTSQPSTSAHSSAYSQFGQLPQELAELGEGICQSPPDVRPSLQVQAGLTSGPSYPLEDGDVDFVCQARAVSAYGREAGGERGGVSRFGQARQFSRNQSKAAHYPMEVTEATMGPPDSLPPLHDYQYHHQGGLWRPLSGQTTSFPAPPPRPLVHSQSINVRFSSSSGNLAGGQPTNHGQGFRTSASAQHMDVTSAGGVTAYHDDLFLISSAQSETCMVEGGTYPGEAGRSSRNTPFMGVVDRTARVHQRYQQQAPSSSASCLSPSRSWAVSSVDTVVTSPSKTPANQGGLGQPQLSSIAYHNRSNNNAHNDNQLDYYPQGEGSGQVASQNPSYRDVKLARTLPVTHSCSDRP
ncbi:hypothetical protein FQN60_003456, partial [Etheostoma spectabile]